jgi:hypothetical protein
MPRRTRRSNSLAAQSVALGFAVPQVVAHRMARMALAGARPSARDRKEFQRMGTEKIAAFNEAWMAMGIEACRANQELALSCVRSLWFPWLPARSAAAQVHDAALGILGKGMAPVRRRAAANARRLRRVRRGR